MRVTSRQNLDNWKSSRRKRVEHIIDRVVEVKKLEEEEHDRNRRKSKTFNELMEERWVELKKEKCVKGERRGLMNNFLFFLSSGSRRKLSSLAIYAEEDTSIDMSGLTSASDVNDSSDKSKINVSFFFALLPY